ncbi:MAG: energy-coupling factor transporter transmembrane component T family protein [Bacilli bacterium]
MNNVLLGKYYPIDSIIHKLDARVKIIATCIFLIGLFITRNLMILPIYLVFIIIIAILAKVKVKSLISSLKPLRFLMLFMIFFNLFFYKNGTIVFEFKFIEIYDEAIYRTVFFLTRIIIMVLYSTMLTLTTAPLELAAAIEALLKPLKRFKFPAHEIGMMISIALRFIPTLFEEMNKIMNAQASRGIDFKNGKIKEKIRGIISLLIPLFVNSLKRADDLANAMEVRGYVGGEGRTDLHDKKFELMEFCYLCIHVIIVIVALVIELGGIL